MASRAVLPTPAASKLEPTEFVLRGGYLLKPVILDGLSVLNGTPYCRLEPTNNGLVLFLTGMPVCKHPLRHSHLIALLKNERTAFVRQRLASQEEAVGENAAENGVDSNLGLDDSDDDAGPVPPSSRSSARLRALNKRNMQQECASIEVDFVVGAATFPLNLLMDTKAHHVPAFEASVQNFQRMFDWLQLEAPVRQQRAAQCVPPSRPLPKHPAPRTYWRKDKGVFYKKELRTEDVSFETPKKTRPRCTTKVIVPKKKQIRLKLGLCPGISAKGRTARGRQMKTNRKSTLDLVPQSASADDAPEF